MQVTIFGGTGLLGKALARAWARDPEEDPEKDKPEDEVQAFGSQDADIRDSRQISALIQRGRPDWIVLAAAYTDVDGCETNPDMAFAVNRRGAANVAEAAKQSGSRLLFVSTDYVFDGTKTSPYETNDVRAPRSVYGASKAEAELEIIRILPEACIVRTSWLFGPGGKCFPDTILKLARSRPEIQVVNDQRGSPTYAADLAQAIIRLCHAGAQGIVHATNRGECTWFEFAREIVAGAGLSTVVRPTTSDQFVRPAERPKYSVLSPASLEHYGIMMPAWQDGLRRFLAAAG